MTHYTVGGQFESSRSAISVQEAVGGILVHSWSRFGIRLPEVGCERLTGAVTQVCPCPHVIGGVIWQVGPIVLVMDDGAGPSSSSSPWMCLECQVGRIWSYGRRSYISLRPEMYRSLAVALPDGHSTQGGHCQVPGSCSSTSVSKHVRKPRVDARDVNEAVAFVEVLHRPASA